MSYQIDDEKITAYVLGELEQTERKTIEKALQSDESLRQRVAEIRATAKLAAETLKSQPAYALTDSQRDVITKCARTLAGLGAVRRNLFKSGRAVTASRPLFRWQVAATILLVAFLGILLSSIMVPSIVGRSRLYQRRQAVSLAPQALVARIGELERRLPEGEFTGEQTAQRTLEKPVVLDETPPTLEAIQTDRYLIKNASMVIEVEDARKASELLVAAVQELGGYVSDFRESVDPLGRRSISAQVRVPATKFQTAMDRLDPLGKVLNRQVYTEDVTEQYVDTDARLRNLKRTEERLLAHLGRTGKLEDIVKVEHEITRVRGEIESLEGRLRFLSHRIEFSTIIITLQETPRTEPIMPPETFSIGKIASEATRSLVGFLQNLTGTLVWLAVWAVVWVPIVIVVILLIRRGLREARKAEK